MSAPSFRYKLRVRAVVAVQGLVRILPDAAAARSAPLVGFIAYVLDHRHRRVAISQLQAAFPRKTPRECQAIARATFMHFGRLLIAVLRFSTLSRDAMRARVEFEGDDRVRAALRRGRARSS